LKFTEFGFNSMVMDGINSMNYVDATPVQTQVIPHIIEGKDIIASAQTGTGKTAAFLLPLMHNLMQNEGAHDSILALVIVPTRELAIQIMQAMEALSYFTNISSIAVYGGGTGDAFVQEKKALSTGVDVVICTPGKMISHLKMGYVKMHDLKYLILDEADRMLDMGFYDDITRIINLLPPKRQNLLFSATMPPKIRTLAKKILNHPVEINISISKPNEKIKQSAYVVYETQKIPILVDLLSNGDYKSVIVFCSTKISVKQLTAALLKKKLNVAEIHSDLEQVERNQVMLDFANKNLPILVATDIVSRGIDIEDIDLVVNFDVPHDGEDYVHRIGRTARAASSGNAITFIAPHEQFKFNKIEELIEREVEKAALPEWAGEAPAYEPNKKQYKPRPDARGGKSPSGNQKFNDRPRKEDGRNENRKLARREDSKPKEMVVSEEVKSLTPEERKQRFAPKLKETEE
jgi:ATP-dependent RNA helicase RhlE